jgi:hypothetical protein
MRNLAPMVISALAQSGLSAQRRELKVTESVLLVDNDSPARHSASIAQIKRADFHGGFRHRVFFAELSPQFPVRQNQDRPLIRPRRQFQAEANKIINLNWKP